MRMCPNPLSRLIRLALVTMLILTTEVSCVRFAKKIQSASHSTNDDAGELGTPDSKYKLADGVEVFSNLSYGSDKQQSLDIYRKKNLTKPAPVFFMVHGGAWMVGDKQNSAVIENKIKKFVQAGAVLVSINYRMSFSPNPLQQVEDVDAALAFVAKNVQKYGGDTSRIVIVGHSAGAHLVSLYSSDKSFQKAGVNFLGTISLDSAALNVEKIMNSEHYGFYDRVFGSDPETWRKNSPSLQLKEKVRPMLLVCSTKRTDSCPQAEEFSEKAKALGSEIRILKVDLTHKEVNQTLGLDSEYTNEVLKFLKQINW